MKNIRTRFAPSPTGGLHLGGVRTALYSYLYAKKHGGQFVLRIEDTDQSRWVAGAEQYIMDCLQWCGIIPDESPENPGSFAPYRQSERKAMYKQYAMQLIEQGHAYYAFDTPEALANMREQYKTAENPSPQYDHHTRKHMRNSLSLPESEWKQLLATGTPYVIRIKMPANETIQFTDMIRGEIKNESGLVDDKVLLKADGMPTYHLAVVVDDYLMQITHAFRGEEWLPSAPVHIKLWEYLGWAEHMPQWAHLPLILKPDGNGKLSKRDGDRLGFPVFAMDWTDPRTNEHTTGFKERGFLPEAFVNMLAMLGWHSGEAQELFSMDTLIEKFSMERVHKGGAKFDYEKAKWFNHEWIKQTAATQLLPAVKQVLAQSGMDTGNDEKLQHIIQATQERCILINDFVIQAGYFFKAPEIIDTDAIIPKWNTDKRNFFEQWIQIIATRTFDTATDIEASFKQLSNEKAIKMGELQMPFRIMLVGGKFGPNVFDIALMLGAEETTKRIHHTLNILP